MNCLLCGEPLRRNDRRCPNCGCSAEIMRKLNSISNKYYNRAIDQVKCSNLTAAYESLKTAVGCNKRNINARNLLGLVCLETGEVGEAFKNWLLSASYQKQKNPAVSYMEYTKDNIVEFDKMDMGIKLYNEALEIMKGCDIRADEPDKIRRRLENALNKLKGAVDFNPKLLKAINLMTLCYIILGERSKALELAKSVLYIDIANPQATLYFGILCPDRTRPPVKVVGGIEKKERHPEVSSPPMENQGFFTSSMFMEAAAFLLGIIACVAVFMILIIPGITEEKDAKIAELENAAVTEVTTGMAAAENGDADINADISRREADIEKAKKLYDTYYYIDALELLYNMDLSGISAESLETYNNIIYNVTLKGANALLDLGQKAYNEGSTENAESFLDKAYTYSENAGEDRELLKTKYTALFYKARLAYDKGEKEQAANLFSQVFADHPDKKYQNYAENYLKSITEE